MIDLLYCTFNRLEFTKASAPVMLANTDWSLVRSVRVHDDGSTDGTLEYMKSIEWPVPSELITDKVGGPVAIMNHFIQQRPSGMFGKVDSDVLLPPGWLNELLRVMEDHPRLDLLGMEARNNFPVAAPARRTYTPADFIGGIGLMRGRAFRNTALPIADGRFGFTQWQYHNPNVVKGWMDPSMPVALLDHLPWDPWRELSEDYISRGWQRRAWGEGDAQYYHPEDCKALWAWWSGAQKEVAA